MYYGAREQGGRGDASGRRLGWPCRGKGVVSRGWWGAGSSPISELSCTFSHLCGGFPHTPRTSSLAQITTLLGKAEKGGDRPAPVSPEKIAELKAKVASQGDVVKAAKEVRCLDGV